MPANCSTGTLVGKYQSAHRTVKTIGHLGNQGQTANIPIQYKVINTAHFVGRCTVVYDNSILLLLKVYIYEGTHLRTAVLLIPLVAPRFPSSCSPTMVNFRDPAVIAQDGREYSLAAKLVSPRSLLSPSFDRDGREVLAYTGWSLLVSFPSHNVSQQ